MKNARKRIKIDWREEKNKKDNKICGSGNKHGPKRPQNTGQKNCGDFPEWMTSHPAMFCAALHFLKGPECEIELPLVVRVGTATIS